MIQHVEILTVGDELLRGELTDSNAAWLATELFQMGLRVGRIVSLGDDEAPLLEHLRRAAARPSLVVITGGLGPTDDDRTSATVARATGCPLERDLQVLEQLRRRFAAAGYPFSENNAKQADFPRGATVLPNERGTAPGFELQAGAARFVCMPGVPSEMKAMFRSSVAPLLASDPQLGASLPRVRVLHTFGMGESQLDRRLEGVLEQLDQLLQLRQQGLELSLHYRTSFPENHVTLVVRGGGEQQATQVLERFEALAHERLGPRVIYGVDGTTLPMAVVAALRQRGATVALAESCTGGLAGDLLTQAPGSSEVFGLGLVTYANQFKQRLLQVPADVLEQHGAVSQPCVEAMAQGVRRLAGATLGVAISGVAGPAGGSADKPVGTVHFALAHDGGVRHLVRRFPWADNRQRIKRIAAHVALALVLWHLERNDGDPLAGRWAPQSTQEKP